MNNLFSFIPDHIDKNLRYALIFLITFQLTSFIIYMFYSIRENIKIMRGRSINTESYKENGNENDNDKEVTSTNNDKKND